MPRTTITITLEPAEKMFILASAFIQTGLSLIQMKTVSAKSMSKQFVARERVQKRNPRGILAKKGLDLNPSSKSRKRYIFNQGRFHFHSSTPETHPTQDSK